MKDEMLEDPEGTTVTGERTRQQSLFPAWRWRRFADAYQLLRVAEALPRELVDLILGLAAELFFTRTFSLKYGCFCLERYQELGPGNVWPFACFDMRYGPGAFRIDVQHCARALDEPALNDATLVEVYVIIDWPVPDYAHLDRTEDYITFLEQRAPHERHNLGCTNDKDWGLCEGGPVPYTTGAF